ncbi:MAG: CUB domain-containing protein, partial [Pirellulaceae bacterium]
VFYDSGGKNGNYNDNELLTFTIFPSTPGSKLQLDFTEFNLSNGGLLELDNLFIINGSDPLTGDVLGIFSGTTSPGTVTSTAADGALSFLFISDGLGNASGWAANISCVTPDEPPTCAVNYNPADLATGVSTDVVLSWEPGTGAAPSAYTVSFGTDPGSLTIVSEDQSGTTYTPSGLLPATTYYWQVIPENVAGQA